MNDDINEYLPSLLNPRGVRKQGADPTGNLTQNSVASRRSLSLRTNNTNSKLKILLNKTFPTGKENEQNNNLLKPSHACTVNDTLPDLPLEVVSPTQVILESSIKTNSTILPTPKLKRVQKQTGIDDISIGISTDDDIHKEKQNNQSSSFSFGDIPVELTQGKNATHSIITRSLATELNHDPSETGSTLVYEVAEKPLLIVTFGVTNCETLNVSTNSGNIKQIKVTRQDNDMDVDCEIVECSSMSLDSQQETADLDFDPSPPISMPPKKPAIAVNLEIKKTNLTENPTENSKVLILNTDAIERLSHVIVQPPNYKLVKRQISDRGKFKNYGKRKLGSVRNGSGALGGSLKQTTIESYFAKRGKVTQFCGDNVVGCEDMSKNLSLDEKCERSGRYKSARRVGGGRASPLRGAGAVSPRRGAPAVPSSPLAKSTSEQRGRSRNNSVSSAPSPRKNVDAVHFSVPSKAAINKASIPKSIPHYKIVAGTHFAVDAFSYGDIPNVKHYFLTHFHSDHYSGLKKTFNKILYCSQVTADLCQTRLGVSSKCIRVVNFDETVTVEDVEVTALDANHCPGALMLVFSLPNGKTMLHTGDFRASPLMESYPVFWNKDIHTIYLDTTYCNPRYDFPTQEHSLEMALYHLRQKKLSLEQAGKKFSSVLIVCGTYTIGKEKFFLGMARRVGCSVWACPEKDKVLQIVEGRSFCSAAPAGCQLHVVPMRDLTHEKLRSYLESMSGAFSEVVAFKPSGWENGKNSTVLKDNVTIHGIPYSEHSSFSEMIRFVKYLKPKQVVPTVDISGGVKAVQKYFPCPLVCKEDCNGQSKVTDFFSIQQRQQSSAVT